MSVFSVNSLKEFGKLLWSIEDERDKTVSDAVTLVIDFISTHHIAKHVLSRCQNVCPSIWHSLLGLMHQNEEILLSCESHIVAPVSGDTTFAKIPMGLPSMGCQI